jgi:hypothetical protein
VTTLHGEHKKLEKRATKLALKHRPSVGLCGIVFQSLLT